MSLILLLNPKQYPVLGDGRKVPWDKKLSVPLQKVEPVFVAKELPEAPPILTPRRV